MADLTQRLTRTAESFDPRTRALAIGRSLLAVAQLSLLLVTPDRLLFLHQLSGPTTTACTGLKGTSLWCATGSLSSPNPIGRILAITVLLCVAAGLRPRWLCIPHWYISFSIAADVTVIDGGARAAEIVAALLIPICLGDTRTWQWTRPTTPMAPSWRGSSYAAHLVLRLQVAIIYLSAALTKSAFTPWRTGEAIQALVRDPQFGAPSAIRLPAEQLLAHQSIAAALTWSIMLVEIAIAVSMATSRRHRQLGTGAAVCLHAAIILLMGLFGFGLIMIAATAITCAGRVERREEAAEEPTVTIDVPQAQSPYVTGVMQVALVGADTGEPHAIEAPETPFCLTR